MPYPLILIPCYNLAEPKILRLLNSLEAQSESTFKVVLSVDGCKSTYEICTRIIGSRSYTFQLSLRFNKKRIKALGNIIKVLYLANASTVSWVGIIDGDDYLCSPDAISHISQEYEKGAKVVWSKFLWDGQSCDLCQDFPENVNPYSYPWVSSHFRTFDLNLLLQVPFGNFLDQSGSFFPRCYDHALMLPLLYLCYINRWKTSHLNEYLYYYDNKGSSIPQTEHTGGLIEARIGNFIRARGFVL